MNAPGGYTVWLILSLVGLSLVSPVLAESLPSMDVPYFAQNVAPWSTQYVGNNSYFIGNAGCALASTAMVFSYYGIDVDPSSLNAWLTLNNGYDAGGNIRWKKAAEISEMNGVQTISLDQANDVKSWGKDLDSPTLADLAIINHNLRSGYPVLAKVWYPDINYAGGWHWVVLTGFSDTGGSTVYTIQDPFLDYSNTNGFRAMTIPDQRFYERQNAGAAGTIYGMVVFKELVPPAGITGLRNITYRQDLITWTWIDPSSADFDTVMVYLDGVFRVNVTKGVRTYTALSLAPGSEHHLATRTVDTTGLVNPDWVNSSARTAPLSPVPQASVTGLRNTTYQKTSITWAWTDPPSADFDHVMVYLDGIFMSNVTNGTQTYHASSLTPGTWHTIGTQSVGTTGLVNLTWVNSTATTAPGKGIVFELDNGWNIFSTPILLESSYASLDQIFSPESISHIEIFLGYDGMYWFTPDSSYTLVPLNALYVKVNGSATAIITPSSIVSLPPIRSLYPGVSLIGSASPYSYHEFLSIPLDRALLSINGSSKEQTEYIQVISPGLNQPVWLYSKGEKVRDILPFKGYWVVIENPDTLYGFSSTPIQ
jgi:hypothetical protein